MGKDSNAIQRVEYWRIEKSKPTGLLGKQSSHGIDRGEAARLKKHIAEEFKEQLNIGAPTNQDEIGLRRLSAQLKARKGKKNYYECE